MPRPAKPFRKGNYFYSDIGSKRTKLCLTSLGLAKAKEIRNLSKTRGEWRSCFRVVLLF